MFQFTKARPSWPIIAAVGVGIIVSLFASNKMIRYASNQVETEPVYVAAGDIAPYTIIKDGDIQSVAKVRGSKQQETIDNPADAVGKIATSIIFKGEQIAKARLADSEIARGKQIVALNVDLARSVGQELHPGDMVDLWWVPAEASPVPGIGWVQVGTNAIIVDLLDANGKSLFTGAPNVAALVSSGSSGAPAVAVLAVFSGEVPRIIGGAVPKSQNIVIAKKFSETPPGGVQDIQ